MSRFGSIVLTVASVLFLATACHHDGFNKSDFEITDVCLKVKGVTVFQYESGASQLALNKGRKEFRAGTDTMSDYFLLKMSELPREDGQVFTGNLQWTTADDIVTRSALSFKVERIDPDGTVWLWCAAQKITIVMKLLN
ncbi:MAG: hypothetical protein IJ654_10320 [Bacteroidales bacterium]|nr:hypothetical protein [Bacteroidales bacterium]